MKRLQRVLSATAALVTLLASCGNSTESANDSVASTTASSAPTTAPSSTEFLTTVQTICYDVGERAYRDVQKVWPEGATSTPKRFADEARIRAGATDDLVDALEALTPASPYATRWSDILTGLERYADHERARAAAIESGAEEPDRPDGLENFRNLGLGGTCNDWLDMN